MQSFACSPALASCVSSLLASNQLETLSAIFSLVENPKSVLISIGNSLSVERTVYSSQANSWLSKKFRDLDVTFEDLCGCPAFQIAYLSSCNEEQVADHIEADTDTSSDVRYSIVPVALHYRLWPSTEIFYHYLRAFFLNYPEFFRIPGADWVDYCLECNEDALAELRDIYPALSILATANPAKYGPAYLYAARVLKDYDGLAAWIQKYGGSLKGISLSDVGYLTYCDSRPAQLALLERARKMGDGAELLLDMLNAEFALDEKGVSLFEEIELTEDERQAILSKRESFSSHLLQWTKNVA